MELEAFLSVGQVIRPGVSLSDQCADVEQMGLNYSEANHAHVWVKVTQKFPEGTKLNIQLIEASSNDLSSFLVREETGDLTEAELVVGSHPLWISIRRTNWRFIGLRYVSSGADAGGALTSFLQVEKPISSKPQFEPRTFYGPSHVFLPPREPMRVG